MAFMSDNERTIVRAFAAMASTNPFMPERVEQERQALGDRFVRHSPVWHAEAGVVGRTPNVERLGEVARELAPVLRDRLAQGARKAGATTEELVDYEGFIRYLMYESYEERLFVLIEAGERGEDTTGRVDFYEDYARESHHFLDVPGVELPVRSSAAHNLAWGYQVRRAFHQTFRQIYGGSMPIARLRADVWRSIFTHDVERYRRSLYDRMSDITTLIVGESGTGKELVARAIGLSRFIPFDEKRRAFTEDFAGSFHPLNLSALSPTLIESELFGHRRGSFTGAVEDRAGWLEVCRPCGTVFLDEIGELDAEIQVKLLRVLQSRTFQRIGESRERRFAGKIVAATNRDLASEMDGGGFRRDFYYRLCADVIETPSLRQILTDSADELRILVGILSGRIAGADEAEELANEVVTWIEANLGADYPWPGNVRELEQCVRNILIRGSYKPAAVASGGVDRAFESGVRDGTLTADEVLAGYVTRVYVAAGSYEEAARRLSLDRRTVKAKVDVELCEQLRAQG